MHATAAGEAQLAPAIVQRMIQEFVRRPAPAATRPPELDELTNRELDVLKLVARGLSNAEIAAELFLGDATVRTHVSRILLKLQLRDRTQAVVLAYESGLHTTRRSDRHRLLTSVTMVRLGSTSRI